MEFSNLVPTDLLLDLEIFEKKEDHSSQRYYNLKPTHILDLKNQFRNNAFQSISSKLDVNNLLNMVQTYQLYRINSNTKSLKS